MNIKNYTTTVSVVRTVGSIESLLVDIGATGITKQFKNNKITALTFTVQIDEERPQSFLLPSQSNSTISLLREIRGYKNKKSSWIAEQAYRVSWRILFNWVEAQCAMVKLGQVEAMQVFLPYLIVNTDGRNMSLYKRMKLHGFDNSKKMLLSS